MNNRKGEPKDFIRHITIHPNIIIHLLAQSLIDSLEVLLHYTIVTFSDATL